MTKEEKMRQMAVAFAEIEDYDLFQEVEVPGFEIINDISIRVPEKNVEWDEESL